MIFHVRAAVLVLSFAALPSHAVHAQASAPRSAVAPADGEIRGRIVNVANKLAVDVGTVDVLRLTSEVVVARATVGVDGRFRVLGVRPGRYRLRVRAIGYTPRELPVIVMGSSGNLEVGTLELTAAAAELQSVVVTAPKDEVLLAPDRNTYSVRDMATTRGGNALDVLRNVPAVDVDIDNNVSLRGNSGVVIQINGRPSPLKPAQLGSFLSQLPANVVEKVEVISNPSARDAPEGVAGIINIVLKRNEDAGLTGGLTTSGSTTGRADLGGSLGYQEGPLSLYGSYGWTRDNRPRSEVLFRQNLYQDPLTFLDESAQRTQIPHANTLTGSAEYTLSKHDELSAEVVYSGRSEAETYGILYRSLSATQTLTGLRDRNTINTNDEFNFESTLGYKHAFAQKSHKLTVELRAFRAKEGGPSTVASRTLAFSGDPLGAVSRETQIGGERPDENALKVDYVQPLSRTVRFETGYKGTIQQFHTTNDVRVLDTLSAVFQPDSTRISDFTYDARVNAAYGMLVAQRGKFVVQGGVRAEHAATTFHLRTLNSTYANRYNSLFPSALIAWNLDDARQVKLSYSSRIRRPDDTDQIDPTLHYADPLNVSRGNPYLKPEYIRSIELGLQRSAERVTMQVTPFFRHTSDAIRTIRTVDSLGVATRTFANVTTSNAYGTDVTVALRGGRVTGFAGTSAYRQVSDAANLSPGYSASTFGWTARTNVSFKVSRTLDVQSLLFYQAAMSVEQGRNSSRARFSVAARQKLRGDLMSVTLRVIDPFGLSHESSTTIDPRFTQQSERRRPIRGLLLNFDWSFGKPQKDRAPDPEGQSGN